MNQQADMFQTVRRSHDGYDRTEIRPATVTPAPEVVVPPRRKGKAREDATATRDASHKRFVASGLLDGQREAVLRCYAETRFDDLTDQELAAMLDYRGKGIPAGRVSGRRNDLLKMSPPLVEKAPKRACRVTGNTVQPWRLSAAGWEAVHGRAAER